MEVQTRIRITLELLAMLLLGGMHAVIAQQNNAGSQSAVDSVNMIKQLLRQQFQQQLNKVGSENLFQKQQLEQLINDRNAVDSLGKIIFHEINALQKSTTATARSVAASAIQMPGELVRQQLGRLMQTAGIKDVISNFTGIAKQSWLQRNGGSVVVNGQAITAPAGQHDLYINSIAIAGSGSFLGVPVSLHIMRQDVAGMEWASHNLVSFQFDRDRYLASIRDKIKTLKNTTAPVTDYGEILQKTRAGAVDRLQVSLDSINQSFQGGLNQQLSRLGNMKNLLQTDMQTIKSQLLSVAFVKAIEENSQLLAQLQQAMNTGETIDTAKYNSLLQTVKLQAASEKLIDAITAAKRTVDQESALKEHGPQKKDQEASLQKILQDPSTLTALEKENLRLTGMQKFFMNITHLKTGMSTASITPLSIYRFLSNGFNVSFCNNKTYLFLMAGRQMEMNSLLISNPAIENFNSGRVAFGLRAGLGAITQNYTHLSLFSYKENGKTNVAGSFPVVPGKTVVATFSRQVLLGNSGYFNVELSTSSHHYNESPESINILPGQNSYSKFTAGNDNFLRRMALSFQWNGSADKMLDYDLHGTITGRAYNNPGNTFLSAGTTDIGGSLKKLLLQQKLQVSVRANYQSFSQGDNSQWQRYNIAIQAKLKLTKGQYFSLCFQPYQAHHLQSDVKQILSAGSRLAVEGNFRKRLGRIVYQHTISFSAISNHSMFNSVAVINRSILVSSMQTITVSNRSFYCNTQFNQAINPTPTGVFGTQLNVEAGLMYTLYRRFTGSSAISYSNAKSWYREAAIRQSLSGQLSERFIIGMYANLAKKIRQYQLNYMGGTRLDWSLQYLLK